LSWSEHTPPSCVTLLSNSLKTYLNENTFGIVHSSDVADIIRKKLERLDSNAATLDKGPVDAFTIIHQSGLARQISWRAQVEEAVKDESDEFWRKV